MITQLLDTNHDKMSVLLAVDFHELDVNGVENVLHGRHKLRLNRRVESETQVVLFSRIHLAPGDYSVLVDAEKKNGETTGVEGVADDLLNVMCLHRRHFLGSFAVNIGRFAIGDVDFRVLLDSFYYFSKSEQLADGLLRIKSQILASVDPTGVTTSKLEARRTMDRASADVKRGSVDISRNRASKLFFFQFAGNSLFRRKIWHIIYRHCVFFLCNKLHVGFDRELAGFALRNV